MPINVCLAIVRDAPTRLIVGTYPPEVGGFPWASAKPDRSCPVIESWDFDCDAGVVRVSSAYGSAASDRQIPLVSFFRLTWGGVPETPSSDEYSHYDLTLCFDEENHSRFVSIPSSSDYLCASQSQIREVVSRVRAFLKPVCPGLEPSAVEDLVTVLRDPAEGFRSIQSKMGRLLADLEDTHRLAQSDSGNAQLTQTADANKQVRDLAKAYDALGHISTVAATRQSRSSGGLVWLAFRTALYIAVGVIVGLWLFGR
jgi:hypothetical protein